MNIQTLARRKIVTQLKQNGLKVSNYQPFKLSILLEVNPCAPIGDNRLHVDFEINSSDTKVRVKPMAWIYEDYPEYKVINNLKPCFLFECCECD